MADHTNKDIFTMAAARAGACPGFKEDHEDECVSDEQVSCLNCRYRRWIAGGDYHYKCMKGYEG